MHEFAVRNVWEHEHYKVLDVDVNQARYFGMPWKRLSEYERRKFENVLFLKAHEQQHKLKILYTDKGRRIGET